MVFTVFREAKISTSMLTPQNIFTDKFLHLFNFFFSYCFLIYSYFGLQDSASSTCQKG